MKNERVPGRGEGDVREGRAYGRRIIIDWPMEHKTARLETRGGDQRGREEDGPRTDRTGQDEETKGVNVVCVVCAVVVRWDGSGLVLTIGGTPGRGFVAKGKVTNRLRGGQRLRGTNNSTTASRRDVEWTCQVVYVHLHTPTPTHNTHTHTHLPVGRR